MGRSAERRRWCAGFIHSADDFSRGFYPSVRKSGRICQLDFYVFEQTCKFLHGRLESGKRAFPVSVNLSRRHFKDPDALAKLQKIAEDNGVPTDLLELELTESIFSMTAALNM